MAEQTWNERVEYARTRSILEVASDLNMELFHQGKQYRWKEHDSLVITPSNNLWKWFSKEDVGGDVIELVQTIKEVDFKQAVAYLNDGEFKQVVAPSQLPKEAFRYYLAPYEQPFDEARQYLKEERGLSDDTIDFFYDKGVLAQANAKVGNDIEPVLVFKNLDENGQVVGAALQGLVANPDKYFGRGYLKQIMKNSQPYNGMHVDIGIPNRLVFAESSIDLMSYYELHKDVLSDVRLISLEGLKTGTMGRHLAQLTAEMERRPLSSSWDDETLAQGLEEAVKQGYFKDGKNSQLLTLAVDNDPKGQQLIKGLRDKGIPVIDATPPKQEDQSKMDWNDYLKQEKAASTESYRLTQAKQKLERLKQESSAMIDTVYRHTAKANGQPMNDKRGGVAYLKRQEQLESKVSDTLMAIKKQEERVEYLEQKERFKAQGLNRRGTGLEMSVQNIPRIREELEKADRGESFFTKETLKRYRKELERLEGIAEKISTVTLSPVAQKLIDNGLVTQWAKQPNLYFVKGLRRVALELNDDGVFQEASKYQARTPEERERVNQLLETQLKEVPVQQAEANSEVAQTVLSDNIKETITEPLSASPRQVTYKEINADNKALSRRLQEKIQAGDLVIHYADDTYFYDVFNRLGNSHPTKLLTEKRLAVLKPLRKQLETITLDNVDAYKQKGTPEQDYLYNEMKPLQRQLGTDISTRFIGELAIAAYNTNNELQGLQADTFGTRFYSESTLEMFSQTIGRIIEYPLTEAGVRTDYSFVTTPNAFLHYLNNQLGEVIINKEMLDHLITQIKNNPIEIISETKGQQVSEAVSTEAIKEVKVTEPQQTETNEKSLERTQETLAPSNDYQIRLQWSESPLLKQEEGQVIPYQTFIETIYQSNEQLKQERGQGTVEAIIEQGLSPYYKTKFDLLASDGTVLDVDLRYNIGDERQALSQILEHKPYAQDLAVLDQEVMASIKKASDVNLKQEKMTGHILGDLSETTQKAAPLPEANKSQPLNGLLPNQTQDQSLLYFTLKDRTKSRIKHGYHAISNNDLNKINHYALGLQQSAKWYRDNLANATIHYFYKGDHNTPVNVQITFEEKHFMHLTGLFPIKDGQTAERTLHDFANGRGEFDNLMIANKGAAFQKLQVLPDLQGILEVNSFYFDDVSEIPQLNKLQMESAIKSDDHDLVTAFRSNGENSYPASLMALTDDLLRQFDKATPGNTMLGIYRERDGQIEQLAINSSYVKDDGQEMLRLLQNKSVQEEVSSPEMTMAKAPLSPKSKLKEAIQRQAKEAMADLAVSSAEKNKDFDYHKASAYELSQQAIQDIKAFTESPEDLKAYLDFMSRFPQLSPRNAALIQAQWPGANAVATFKQWQELGKALDLGDADVMASKRTYTNKRTGESKEVVDHNLSVKAGERSQITLFRPVMVAMIPVLDDKGKQVINQKGNPKFKPLSQATPDEKALVKAQKLNVSHFQDVDAKGNRKFMTYKVFELSQTTLKPESYPKAMPNRHYDFNLDQVKTKEVLQGLQDYANYIKVSIATDGHNGQDKQLGNAKGAFYPLEQKIVLNPNNTQGETISTTIHELAHATLHNPQLTQGKQNDLPKPQKELEAEMTSYLVSKHFGLDTAEKAIPYMAKWTKQLKGLTDEDLSRSMTRVHQTVARMVKSVETYTQPYALKKSPTRPQAPLKKPSKGRNL
ncbi:PBECR4 domain-containing protein [Streptococcus suis]|nr:PBECR4 domain-containing protein [Streptococcus suis]